MWKKLVGNRPMIIDEIVDQTFSVNILIRIGPLMDTRPLSLNI
jgi:hypothetical protein